MISCEQTFSGVSDTHGMLVARVRSGDQLAARELVDAVRAIVTRIARANSTRRVSEEDMVQEILIKMFVRLPQYRGDAPFEHWLCRIAINTCTDRIRFECRRPELRWADLSSGQTLLLEKTCHDPASERPGRTLANQELLDRLLSRLCGDDRDVIVWFELEGRTIAEIEARTGWSETLVKTRLYRARRKLQRYFAELRGHDGPGREGAPRWRRGHHTKRERKRRTHAEQRSFSPVILPNAA